MDEENKNLGSHKPRNALPRRSSILRDCSPGRLNEKSEKRVSFAGTRSVKEFFVESLAEWNQLYEAPVADSSDASDLSCNKILVQYGHKESSHCTFEVIDGGSSDVECKQISCESDILEKMDITEPVCNSFIPTSDKCVSLSMCHMPSSDMDQSGSGYSCKEPYINQCSISKSDSIKNNYDTHATTDICNIQDGTYHMELTMPISKVLMNENAIKPTIMNIDELRSNTKNKSEITYGVHNSCLVGMTKPVAQYFDTNVKSVKEIDSSCMELTRPVTAVYSNEDSISTIDNMINGLEMALPVSSKILSCTSEAVVKRSGLDFNSNQAEEDSRKSEIHNQNTLTEQSYCTQNDVSCKVPQNFDAIISNWGKNASKSSFSNYNMEFTEPINLHLNSKKSCFSTANILDVTLNDCENMEVTKPVSTYLTRNLQSKPENDNISMRHQYLMKIQNDSNDFTVKSNISDRNVTSLKNVDTFLQEIPCHSMNITKPVCENIVNANTAYSENEIMPTDQNSDSGTEAKLDVAFSGNGLSKVSEVQKNKTLLNETVNFKQQNYESEIMNYSHPLSQDVSLSCSKGGCDKLFCHLSENNHQSTVVPGNMHISISENILQKNIHCDFDENIEQLHKFNLVDTVMLKESQASYSPSTQNNIILNEAMTNIITELELCEKSLRQNTTCNRSFVNKHHDRPEVYFNNNESYHKTAACSVTKDFDCDPVGINNTECNDLCENSIKTACTRSFVSTRYDRLAENYNNESYCESAGSSMRKDCEAVRKNITQCDNLLENNKNIGDSDNMVAEPSFNYNISSTSSAGNALNNDKLGIAKTTSTKTVPILDSKICFSEKSNCTKLQENNLIKQSLDASNNCFSPKGIKKKNVLPFNVKKDVIHSPKNVSVTGLNELVTLDGSCEEIGVFHRSLIVRENSNNKSLLTNFDEIKKDCNSNESCHSEKTNSTKMLEDIDIDLNNDSFEYDTTFSNLKLNNVNISVGTENMLTTTLGIKSATLSSSNLFINEFQSPCVSEKQQLVVNNNNNRSNYLESSISKIHTEDAYSIFPSESNEYFAKNSVMVLDNVQTSNVSCCHDLSTDGSVLCYDAKRATASEEPTTILEMINSSQISTEQSSRSALDSKLDYCCDCRIAVGKYLKLSDISADVIKSSDEEISFKIRHNPFYFTILVTKVEQHYIVSRVIWGPKLEDLKRPLARCASVVFEQYIDDLSSGFSGKKVCEISQDVLKIIDAFSKLRTLVLNLVALSLKHGSEFYDSFISVGISDVNAHILINLKMILSLNKSSSSCPYFIKPEISVVVGHIGKESLQESVAHMSSGSHRVQEMADALTLYIENFAS